MGWEPEARVHLPCAPRGDVVPAYLTEEASRHEDTQFFNGDKVLLPSDDCPSVVSARW